MKIKPQKQNNMRPRSDYTKVKGEDSANLSRPWSDLRLARYGLDLEDSARQIVCLGLNCSIDAHCCKRTTQDSCGKP